MFTGGSSTDKPVGRRPEPLASPCINGLTRGQVRAGLNAIRRAGPMARSDMIMHNGWTMGKFAIAYLQGHHMNRGRREVSGVAPPPPSSPEAEEAEVEM